MKYSQPVYNPSTLYYEMIISQGVQYIWPLFPEEALYPSLLVAPVMDICKPYIIKNVLDKQKIYIYSYDINRLGNFFNPFLHCIYTGVH